MYPFQTIQFRKDFIMGKKSVEITGISTSSIKVLSHSEMLELFKEYSNKNKEIY